MDKQRILRQIASLAHLASSGQSVMPGALDQLRAWANDPDPEIAAYASQAYAQIVQAHPSLATSNTNLNTQDPYQQAETLNRMSGSQQQQAITAAQADAERNAPYQHGYVFDPLERATSAVLDWLGRSGMAPVTDPVQVPPVVGNHGVQASGAPDLGGTPTPTPEVGTTPARITAQPTAPAGRRYTPDLFTPNQVPAAPASMASSAAPAGVPAPTPPYTPSFLSGGQPPSGGPAMPSAASAAPSQPGQFLPNYGTPNETGVGSLTTPNLMATASGQPGAANPNAVNGLPMGSVDPNSWLAQVGSELYNPNFNISPGNDPTQGADLVLRSYLQANNLPAGMQSYLEPYAQSAQGLLRLSNPGANLTPVQELNGFGSLISGLQQPGHYLDPVPLYHNIFSPQFAPTATSPISPLSPQDQIGAVSGAFQALQPLLPQDTYASLSDLLNQAILSWSDQMNQTGGQGPDLISYLQQIGADQWLG